jgi:hypothetical protein
MQTQRFFPLRWAAIIGALVLAACLTISPWPYDAARGFSIASVTSPVSNTASKGDQLTSGHPKSSARATAQPEQITAKHSGKIPVGCETAFSKLAHRADLSAARCIT